MRKPLLPIFATLLAFPPFAWGETLTAVCKDPKGRAIGVEGRSGGNKPVDEPDGMRGGQLTLVWEVGKNEAQVVTQGASGGSPLQEKAIRIHSSEESATFIVTYHAAVWLYSIFQKPRRLLITQHTNGYFLDSDGAIAKSMEARCEISLK